MPDSARGRRSARSAARSAPAPRPRTPSAARTATGAECTAANSAAAAPVPSCAHLQAFRPPRSLRRTAMLSIPSGDVSTCASVRHGRPRHRIGRAEQHHHRHAERRRDVRRAAVVADEQAAPAIRLFTCASGAFCQTSEVRERRSVVGRARQKHRLEPGYRAGVARPRGIAPPARSSPAPTRTDESRRTARDPARVAGEQLRARDLGPRHAQPEHRRGEMFRRVHRPSRLPESPAPAESCA